MKRPKPHTRFCGIDVAKRAHVACIIDRDGRSVRRSCSFGNDAEGYQNILARLGQAGGPGKVLVGMEATGHSWYGLHEFLSREGYQVVVLNPIQTGQYQAPRGHISKRGSPFLRRALWGMALRALQQEGDLRDFWLRKRREGLHHLAAVTAAAAKLCHVAWRISIDRRDYIPNRSKS